MKTYVVLLVLMSLALVGMPASAQMPSFDDLTIGEWTQIDVPDGMCLYGSEYSFFVRPNEQPSDNLLIYFQGGGACWDGLTCGTIGEFASFFEVDPNLINFYREGLFDFDNEDNPLLDYDVVFLPYCTGDVHTGSNQIIFDVPAEANADFDEIEVFFNGHTNSQLVLNWVYENFTTPEQIVVSGCSAGGYGAVAQATFIMEHYDGVPATMIADSSHGVLVDDWSGLTVWGTLNNLPDFVAPFATVDVETYDTSYHIEVSATYFPDNQFGQFNSYIDGVQIGFYAASQGQELDFENNGVAIAAQWSARLYTNTLGFENFNNINYYTSGGFQHCVVNRDLFYQFDQSGVMFSQWFGDVIAGQADNVSCSVLAGDCFESPVEED